MKLKKNILWILLAIIALPLQAQDFSSPEGELPSDLLHQSQISPQKLEEFQDEDRPTKFKDSNTVQDMYQRVNFVDLRSTDFSVTLDEGIKESRNGFKSMNGFSLGLTFEFPVMAKALNGGTPVLKVRAGKSEIDLETENEIDVEESSSLANFVESLGVSEVYTVGVGGGYCYHSGFNCIYGLYNSYLTGQLATTNEEGNVTSTPTQLRGFTVGMSSTFEFDLGIEATVGAEYSILEHNTSVYDSQRINALNLVVGLGVVQGSRYRNMRQIQYVE